jgi:predicted enzyme related to lactoylglutathione lyase
MCSSISGALVGVVVYAQDVDRVADFYAEVAQLDVVERSDGFVVLSDGGCEVSVVAAPPGLAMTIEMQEPPDVREETPVKPCFRVSSLAEVVAKATDRGGGTRDIASAWDFRGLRHLDGFDPEGNVVQFVVPVDPGRA